MKIKNKKIIVGLVLSFILSLGGGQSVLAAGPSAIDLGTASNFVILSKTGISTTGTTNIVGNIGVSPAEATYITGFNLILPAGGAYSTSSLVTGNVYAPSYANPTPANISTAISDMQTAYTDGAGRSLGAITELNAGNIGGLTLLPGLYKWGTGVIIPRDVTLSGNANDIWIFQIAQNLNISSATKILLIGGAKANNVFWIVAGQTTIGTGSTFNGNILDQTAIVLNTGATFNGRALAQSAVTLDANAVTLPSSESSSSNFQQNPISIETPNVNTNSGQNSNYISNTTSSNNNNEAISVIVRTNEEGCSNGNKFNTVNGHVCVNNIIINEQGCLSGYLFNTINGHVCNNNYVTKYNFGLFTLRYGSKGEEVKNLQKFLNEKLNSGLVIDGTYGFKTIEMVKQWQKENGLINDGVVGNLTKTKIYENK